VTEPTQEQLRTEAYWRSTIARELYDRADQMERNAWSKTAGMALASIVRDAGNKVGQMPDRRPARVLVAVDLTREYHWGRAWAPSELEAECPCPKARCGFVIRGQASDHCDQHNGRKTMRGGHFADRCPGGA
jgi:hypothetical protein